MAHCALPVIMGMPPVLTPEFAVALPEVLDALEAEPVFAAPELGVVCAAVEGIELLPVAPGAAPFFTMVTAWAPMSVP